MEKLITSNYINSDSANPSITLCKDKDKFIIYLKTQKSYHYCTNGCHDCWGGRLISNENIIILNDIFEFLRKNMDTLIDLNRFELYIWIESNKNIFLLDYFPDIYNELKSYLDEKINIFSDEFYENFKQKYIEYVGNSDDEELKYNLGYVSNKNNFICDEEDLFQKIDIYMSYKNLDMDNILNDNIYEIFNKIIFINNTYQDMVYNLESTLS